MMMVYMVRYGTGQGNFSTVMSDKNKKHLKEIFDEMNHFASETVTDTIRAGESLGIMTSVVIATVLSAVANGREVLRQAASCRKQTTPWPLMLIIPRFLWGHIS